MDFFGQKMVTFGFFWHKRWPISEHFYSYFRNLSRFVVFSKRHEVLEARLRVFCMTDDKEEKTLEGQEHFTEIAKSRDVEVLEGKSHFVEFGGNLVPVTKSGDQLSLRFYAFRLVIYNHLGPQKLAKKYLP